VAESAEIELSWVENGAVGTKMNPLPLIVFKAFSHCSQFWSKNGLEAFHENMGLFLVFNRFSI
jgi:hypothetical protein